MPLFTTKRDALLLKHFFKEKMHKFDSIEVEIFKLALSEMEINLYNESSKKVYYNPVRVFSTPTKEAFDMVDVDTGIDAVQTVSFFFLRDDLIDRDLVLEEGDIVRFDEKYYEIDNTRSTNYWAGKNPETLPVVTEGRTSLVHGYNVSIVADTHLTRISQLNIIDNRSGVNTIKSSGFMPRNL